MKMLSSLPSPLPLTTLHHLSYCYPFTIID